MTRERSDAVGLARETLCGVVALTGLLIGVSPPAKAEILAEQGDVLLVSVLEDQELGREARVSANGTIMLPRLNEIEVAGQDLSAIRARIETELRDRGIINMPTVIVEFVSYRPFYVDGAVAKPGAIPFEPGLTVRHALILAGGLDTDSDSEATSQDIDELRSRLRLSSYELLQYDSLIARLNAELQHSPTIDQEELDRGLVANADADGVLTVDSAFLGNRSSQWDKEQEHRQTALALVDAEIEILQRQAALQEHEQQLQAEELENARSLVEQGVMPRSQLQDLQREASQISRDLLDSQAFSARAEQERASREFEIETAETEWRLGIQEDLRAAMLERVRLRTEIEVLSDRLLALGLRMDESGALVRSTPQVTIHRSGASGSGTLPADMDTVVLPGDILDVVLIRQPQG